MAWQKVVTAADCRYEEWDQDMEQPICPACDTAYADCPCPGPMQDDEFEYKEEDGVLFARPIDHKPCKAMCDKVTYASRTDARNAARGIGERERRFSMHSYQCPHCRKWHLTSSSKRKR